MCQVLIRRSLIAVCLSLFVITAIVQADDKGKNRGKGNNGGGAQVIQGKVEGIITAGSPNSVTITTQSGLSVTVLVNAATKVERNGRHVLLAALKIGDRGQAEFITTTFVASKVESVGP